jgi:hypothetical protein
MVVDDGEHIEFVLSVVSCRLSGPLRDAAQTTDN